MALLLAAPAFSQSNASVGGIITDATQGVLPGVTVTATNADTGIAKTVVSNAAGAYNFVGMQVGMYTITAELAGFQTTTFKEIKLGNQAVLKLNITLEVKKLEQQVEVNVQSENLLLESTASPGMVLPEKKVNELPLVNSNVLSLIKVMGGVTLSENPIFGADDTQFAGVSASNVNLQRDGVTVNDVRYATGLNSPVYLNPEMVGEFKLVLAPVDAEMGRGNGQVQVVTRSGANAFHGSAVWNNQNTFLDANEWYDNRRQVPRDWRNQNEYTLSLGGPIIKNKTFFFVSWDQQFSRIRQNNVNPTVPTPCARKTIWRWFDGWQGGNLLTNTSTVNNLFSPPITPVVNADGSPRTDLLVPGTTTPSKLHWASVFGPLLKNPATNDCSDVTIDASTGFPTADWVDYAHPIDTLHTPDTTGYIKKFMTYIPEPNNYQAGDGLNWGGLRWIRHLNGGDNIYGIGEGPNRKQISFRIDHNFSARHRVSGTYSYESDRGEDSFPTMPQNSYGGILLRKPQSFSINFTSTIKATLLNEARIGLSRTSSYTYDPLFNPETGKKLYSILQDLYPTNSGIPVVIGLGSPGFAIAGGINVWGSGRGNFAATWGGHDPRWTYADTITWTKGRHSMKFGAEVQRTQSWQSITGQISFTTGSTGIPGVQGGGARYSGFGANSGFHSGFYANSATMPGAVGGQFGGNVVGGIYNLLNIYSGAITSVDQWRFVTGPKALTYNDISKGENARITDYRQNQFSWFAQDSWKLTNDFTFIYGVRYEWYGVPYLMGGMTSGLKGGALAAFGRSGNSFADWMKPGTVNADGSVTYKGTDAQLAFIGPDSPNPNQKIYNDDWNNFGPNVGFSWSLPWFGEGKTILSGGFQLSYMPPGRAFAAAFTMPKIEYANHYTPNTAMPYINLSNLGSLLPVVPLQSNIKPAAADPTFPVQQRSQGITVYDPNLKASYIQNLNMSLTRNITPNVTLNVRYIGSLSRKQTGTINLNAANIWNNGLKEAFDIARAGGESELLDRMFNGINIAGNAYRPVGTVYNGVLQTGAMHLRGYSGTYSNLANGNYIGLAGTLATMNYTTTYTGNSGLPAIGTDTAGTVLRYNGFPENFIYTSPQFSSVTWTGNLNHANYHSMMAQVTVRPVHGFSFSGTYTWARNLGSLGYTDPRNRALDYGVNGMNRTHQIAVNGTFEMPFGPGRWLLNSNNGIVSRIAGGWQLSWITNFATGRPFTLSSQSMLYGAGVPDRVGPFDPKSGHVHWDEGASTGNYFWDDSINNTMYAHVKDPQCFNVTMSQSLQNQCSLQALVLRRTLNADGTVGPQTQYIFVNPYPTERGNFQQNSLNQLAVWSADMAMSKAIRITEGKTLQFRVDATNIFNHPQPSYGASQSGVVRVRIPGAPVAALTSSFDMATFTFITRPLGYLDAKVGARTFQAKVRLDF